MPRFAQWLPLPSEHPKRTMLGRFRANLAAAALIDVATVRGPDDPLRC